MNAKFDWRINIKLAYLQTSTQAKVTESTSFHTHMHMELSGLCTLGLA